jgi:hypothetical protein
MGLDTLQGGSGEAILIGGTTTYDSKPAALAVVMREWTSTRSFAERWGNLEKGITDRIAGFVQLKRQTSTNPKGKVLDDKARDVLLAGLGSDWFVDFATDEVHDRGTDHR